MMRPRVDQKIADRERPRHGTPFGDERVGHCALPTCQKRVARADAFIVTMAGDIYHRDCWAKVIVRKRG